MDGIDYNKNMIPLQSSTQGIVERAFDTRCFRFIDTMHNGGCCLGRHRHARPGITLVTGGSYQEQTDDGTLMCHPGVAVFKPANAFHSNHYGLSGARALHIELVEENFPGARFQLPNRIVTLEDERSSFVGSLLTQEFAKREGASDLSLVALGMELVSLAIRSTIPSFRIRRPPPWLETVIRILEIGDPTRLSLGSLSNATGKPPRTIARQFRRWTGYSVGEYSTKLRIRQAMERLKHGRQNIAQVALELGFCDQCHFSRFFKKETGFSPAEYRTFSVSCAMPRNA